MSRRRDEGKKMKARKERKKIIKKQKQLQRKNYRGKITEEKLQRKNYRGNLKKREKVGRKERKGGRKEGREERKR